jgi:hypothetical protein
VAYRVFSVALDAVKTDEQIVAPNTGISLVHVLVLTPGVAAVLSFGAQDDIPVFPGYVAELCPPALDGLFVSNPIAAAGARMVVQVWFEGGSSGGQV